MVKLIKTEIKTALNQCVYLIDEGGFHTVVVLEKLGVVYKNDDDDYGSSPFFGDIGHTMIPTLDKAVEDVVEIADAHRPKLLINQLKKEMKIND